MGTITLEEWQFYIGCFIVGGYLLMWYMMDNDDKESDASH